MLGIPFTQVYEVCKSLKKCRIFLNKERGSMEIIGEEKLPETREFLDMMETSIRKVLGEFITPELLSYLSLNAMSISKKIKSPGDLMNIKSLCSLLKVSRQTVYNWRKKEKTRNMIEPFTHVIDRQVFYDQVGICVVLAQNQNIFHNRNYDDFLKTMEDREDFRYKLIKAKIAGNQLIPDKDWNYYWDECERRGEENILRKGKK
jgi:hypothetical protein